MLKLELQYVLGAICTQFAIEKGISLDEEVGQPHRVQIRKFMAQAGGPHNVVILSGTLQAMPPLPSQQSLAISYIGQKSKSQPVPELLCISNLERVVRVELGRQNPAPGIYYQDMRERFAARNTLSTGDFEERIIFRNCTEQKAILTYLKLAFMLDKNHYISKPDNKP